MTTVNYPYPAIRKRVYIRHPEDNARHAAYVWWDRLGGHWWAVWAGDIGATPVVLDRSHYSYTHGGLLYQALVDRLIDNPPTT